MNLIAYVQSTFHRKCMNRSFKSYGTCCGGSGEGGLQLSIMNNTTDTNWSFRTKAKGASTLARQRIDMHSRLFAAGI